MSAVVKQEDLIKTVKKSHASSPARTQVVACIDAVPDSGKTVPYGVMAAKALAAELTLLHVIETKENSRVPYDPITSELRHRETLIRIEELAQKCDGEAAAIHTTVLEGRPAEQICRWALNHEASLIVVSAHDNGSAPGDTVRSILSRAAGTAVLVVPNRAPMADDASYRRIMAPLDGSSRAETALPLALRLARSFGAELMLAHAVPEPEFTEIGPREPEDEELRQRLMRRNETVARTYLNRVQTRLADQSVNVITEILSGGDARHLLARTVSERNIDLVVMSSHGRSGHVDMAAGNTANHLITHAPVPVVVVRDSAGRTNSPHNQISSSSGLRFAHQQVA